MKRVRIYLNGKEVGTGVLAEDEKSVGEIRFHPQIPAKDRERLLKDRELKVQEKQRQRD